MLSELVVGRFVVPAGHASLQVMRERGFVDHASVELLQMAEAAS